MNVILVVNDYPQNLALLTTQLLLLNYQVAASTIHDDAYEIAHRLRPSLIMMEFSRVDIDEASAIRRFKADESLGNIPIIVVSTRSTADSKTRAHDAGCDAYITKPYDATHLKHIIKQFFATINAQSPARENLIPPQPTAPSQFSAGT
ncbi:MAG: response regulator [Burkholderiales bacterium]|nr:response regulator [Anaerolineae bacterium]